MDEIMSKQIFATGMQVRRDMFGPELAEKAMENASGFSRPFQEIMTRYCFGEVWSRAELGRRDRSLATLSMLIAQGREFEIQMHVKAGLNNGLTVEEIREIILHAIVYCGIPAAHVGLRAAEQALIDLGMDATS